MVMVLTHCDHEQPIDRWWTREQKSITGRYKWALQGVASVSCLSDADIRDADDVARAFYERRRSDSKTAVINLISTQAALANAPVASPGHPISPVIERVVQFLAEHFKHMFTVTSTGSTISEFVRRILGAESSRARS